MFIVNKDLGGSGDGQDEESKDPNLGNITKKAANKLWLGLNRMLKAKPDTNYFGLLLCAGHGMMFEGRQRFLLNIYDKQMGFYFLYPIEH